MKAARFLSCLFFAAVGLDAVQSAAQQSTDPSAGLPPVTDPLAKELQRCQALQDQGASDPKCQAASDEATRQFFQPPADYRPSKVEMFPKTQNQPWTTGMKPNPGPTDK